MTTFVQRLLNRSTFAFTALTLALLLSGCATGRFNRDWKQAGLATASEKPVEGRWSGYWVSDVNGHTGQLRCLITHTHGKNYRFHYWSSFWKVFHYQTTLTFRLEERDGALHFEGTEELGDIAGGLYEYQGSFTGTNFTATYKSAYDHGKFQMQRVE